jgi:hypothetical protein
MNFLEEIVKWYTSEKPLFPKLPQEFDMYDIMSAMKDLLENINDITTQIQHKQIWFSHPEQRPFIYFDEAYQDNNVAWLFFNETDVFQISRKDLDTATQEILQITQHERISPEITAKLLVDIEKSFQNKTNLLHRRRELDN